MLAKRGRSVGREDQKDQSGLTAVHFTPGIQHN